jgi:hypothetical protein
MQSLIDALKSVSANLSYPGELERLVYKVETEVNDLLARLAAAEAAIVELTGAGQPKADEPAPIAPAEPGAAVENMTDPAAPADAVATSIPAAPQAPAA